MLLELRVNCAHNLGDSVILPPPTISIHAILEKKLMSTENDAGPGKGIWSSAFSLVSTLK